MLTPGARNLITDVAGILVGNAQASTHDTGVTVITTDGPRLSAAVDVRGGGPATRETDLLAPDRMVSQIDAICLSGGSVYGLAAADGVIEWLARQNRGFPVGGLTAPIVPAASLFDLNSGNDSGNDSGEDRLEDVLARPYRALGMAAAEAAGVEFGLGDAGAGLGARAGRVNGGLGSVSICDDASGLSVGALVAANPVGSVLMPGSDVFWAWPFEQNAEFGGRRPDPAITVMADSDLPAESRLGGHTTLAVVAVNASLDKAQAQRVATMAQDGLARAIRPVHSPFDGDCVFVLATGELPDPPDAFAIARIGSLAADCVARATARAVYEAGTQLAGVPAYRDLMGQ